jgi:hypothetical protein
MSRRTEFIAYVAFIAFVLLGTAAALAAETIEIPITTVLRGDPGQVFPIGTVPAQPGDECVAQLEARNNESIHPDSDILVGSVTFFDVEDRAFQAAGFTFIATGPIDVAVRLGADGVFSAGFLLEVTCNPPTTTSTSPPSTTSTTTATSTSEPDVSTTTLSPPPVGGVPAGGGSEAIASVSDVAIQLGVALLIIGGIALAGGWWIGRKR